MTDRDTRAEFLRAGDRVRYMGTWLDIAKVRRGVDRFGEYVALTCETDGADRTVFFRPGCFVAAECMERVSA